MNAFDSIVQFSLSFHISNDVRRDRATSSMCVSRSLYSLCLNSHHFATIVRVPRQRKFANKAEDLEHIDEESFRTIAMELWGARFSSTSRLPDINSILKPYKIMAMVTVDVAHSTGSKSNEYEVVIQQVGKIGLHLVSTSASTTFRRIDMLLVIFVGACVRRLSTCYAAYCAPQLKSSRICQPG